MAIAGILSAFGLSGAAGLTAYVPLMLVAILGRAGVIHLGEPFDILTRWWAMTIIGVLLVIELVVDKIPGVDHVNDIVQTFVRPATGAILFAASAGVITDMHPAVPLVCGLMIAFSVHATKAAARPVVNASTLGFGAPVVSTIEDVIAAVTSLVAVFLPFIIAAFVVVFVAVALVIFSLRRKLRVDQAKSRGAVA
ncbi:DUF4126 domain-containing protein [soil metagenome]